LIFYACFALTEALKQYLIWPIMLHGLRFTLFGGEVTGQHIASDPVQSFPSCLGEFGQCQAQKQFPAPDSATEWLGMNFM
jgi:hypothetical protein